MRRLQMVIYPIVFFDALLMFALVPLLPDYVDALSMSKAQAGAVIGIYSAATLVMALPAGRVADRFGPRRITIAGVALMTASTLVYAFAHSFWMLLAARGGQGTASAISWTAGLAWLSSGTPPQRRGTTLGMAMTCGSVGALLGPVLMGPLSSWLGIRTPFVLLAAVALVLTGLAAWPADVRSASEGQVGFVETIRLAARSRLMACAVLVMSLVAVDLGSGRDAGAAAARRGRLLGGCDQPGSRSGRCAGGGHPGDGRACVRSRRWPARGQPVDHGHGRDAGGAGRAPVGRRHRRHLHRRNAQHLRPVRGGLPAGRRRRG